MTIAQEEVFGPVLAVIPYEDDDDAVRIANDSIYGLSGGVLQRHPRSARSRSPGASAPGRWAVNGGMWFGADSPFGGYRQSGLGRENGHRGLRGVPRDQGDRLAHHLT